ELAEALVRRPQRPLFLQRRGHVGRTMTRHPGLEDGGDLGPRRPTVGLEREVYSLLLLDPGAGVGEAPGLGQRLEVTVGEDADHHVPSVLGSEVAAEGTEDLVAEARPVDLVDHRLA